MFFTALTNVAIALMYSAFSFILYKMKKVSTAHLPTVSAILVYIGTPFMELSAFMSIDYSPKLTLDLANFFVVSIFLQALFIFLIFLVFRKRFHESKYRIFTIASTLGNVGFFGLPIIRALLPSHPEVAAYAVAYIVSMNIIVFTVGAFCVTGNRKFISLKAAIFNPTVLGFAIAFPAYLFGVKSFLPDALLQSISTLAGMTMPLCMLVLGIRLASLPAKNIFGRPIVYGAALMKLLIFPVFCYAAVYFLPFSYAFKVTLLVLSGTPCAAVILSLSEMYEHKTEFPAEVMLLSSILSVITIPVLTLLV